MVFTTKHTKQCSLALSLPLWLNISTCQVSKVNSYTAKYSSQLLSVCLSLCISLSVYLSACISLSLSLSLSRSLSLPTHRQGRWRTFHNSKEPGGVHILRKQQSLPDKLSRNQRLLGVITVATVWPLNDWGGAPPSCPLPPTTLSSFSPPPVEPPVTYLLVSHRHRESQQPSARMGPFLLLTSMLLFCCKDLWCYIVP